MSYIPSKMTAKEAIDAGLSSGILSFSRSVQLSEAMLYARRSDDDAFEEMIEVFEKGIRGQTANDVSLQSMKKHNPGKPSPHIIHSCVMPGNADLMEVRFYGRILGNSRRAHSSDNPNVVKANAFVVDRYAELGGFHVMAELYVWNLANARFAWRNRYSADSAKVILTFNGKRIVFNPFEIDIMTYPGLEAVEKGIIEGEKEDLEELVELFSKGFSGEKFSFTCSFIGAYMPYSELHPSEPYARYDAKKHADVTRIYAHFPAYQNGRLIKHASIHSQKIGSALRAIDIWHENEEYGAVPVNPFAGVQETGEVLRLPKSGKSFYDIRANVARLIENLDAAKNRDEISPDAHFFVANLVRGGVFSSGSK